MEIRVLCDFFYPLAHASPRRRGIGGTRAWVRISALSVAVRRTQGAAPKSCPKKDNDPHAMPRLRCRAPTTLSQAMQPLQDALLRRQLPETTLGRGWP